MRQRLQRRAQLCIVAANQQQLAIGQQPRDLPHYGRSLPAEQHQPHRLGRVEAQPCARRRPLFRRKRSDLVKSRIQNHARNAMHLVFGMPHCTRLLHRLRRTADEMLHLVLDPEVRRVIRNVGEDGDKRHSRQRPRQALAQRPVQIRHQRNHHLRTVLPPEPFQQAARSWSGTGGSPSACPPSAAANRASTPSSASGCRCPAGAGRSPCGRRPWHPALPAG